MQIGTVAGLVGLSLRTVRYYEEEGLVLPVARTKGGFRLYDHDAVERFRLIMKMKPLGFTVDEMRLVLDAFAALAAGDVGDERRAELVDRLEGFSIAAAAKVSQLQEQLQIAESFAGILAVEVARQRARGSEEKP